MIKGTLEMIVERMKKYRSLYEQNEMAVRDQIVNPILRALGWNPENPEEVQPNISTEEGVPDYSLIKDGNRVLIIEAKKLSVDIEQKEIIRQLAKYCFGEGMKYGMLSAIFAKDTFMETINHASILDTCIVNDTFVLLQTHGRDKLRSKDIKRPLEKWILEYIALYYLLDLDDQWELEFGSSPIMQEELENMSISVRSSKREAKHYATNVQPSRREDSTL